MFCNKLKYVQPMADPEKKFQCGSIFKIKILNEDI